MTRTIRSQVALALVLLVSGAVGFSQSSGEAVYNSNCKSCHGATGTPNPAMAKMMGIKATSDPDMQKLTAAQMFTSVKDGKGKMKPFGGKLTDDQIKDSVAFFRTLK
jgi:mono/diheme cytochrome c family protein